MYAILLNVPLTLALCCGAAAGPADWSASWIWKQRDRFNGYNDSIEARKVFELPAFTEAALRITADSQYRLYVNGEWVNDGPSRSWPNHYQYDVIDLAPYLKPGANEIRVIAKFLGIGTFHQLPQEAGLLAQLDVKTADGKMLSIGTDASWEVRDATAWVRWAPKQSVQMGIFEIYDARNENAGAFEPAVVRYAAGAGPWRNLEPRDCPLLTRKPFALRAFTGANVIQKPAWDTFVFPTAAWAYDTVVAANNKVAIAGAFVTMVNLEEAGTLTIDARGNNVQVDDKRAKDNAFTLEAGPHFVAVALSEYFGHWNSDSEIRIAADVPYTLKSALDDSADAPWAFVKFPDSRFETSDYEWALMSKDEQEQVRKRLDGIVRTFITDGATREGFRAKYAANARPIMPGEWTEAVHFLFMERKVAGAANVPGADALVQGRGPVTITPDANGDIELIYDLGEQNVGYYRFDIEAEAGLTVDIAGVEYITPDGRVQHTGNYRNAMRYVCKEGRNTFTSLARRSGRFLFITLRNQTRPATIHSFDLVESTYPVQRAGWFECSDPRLTDIWKISERTLKLCMEDSFTDCPLYEQTLWVGDSRNEAVFGYTAFGSADLALRCMRLAAYSLEEYPIVLCQVPSTWGTLLPAWSFLWGIMAWDYYEYTGDREAIAWVYPYLIKNLRGAAQYTDSRGLFSGPFWNMFDWTSIDDGHNTVLHNSMFAAGAADAALKCAEVLGDQEHVGWLREYRDQLVNGLNALYDEKKGAYPDSVHNDGKISEKTCMHTAFLALLYDVAPEKWRATLLDKVLNPPEGTTGVGSPFAMLYLYDALEKMGQGDRVVEQILKCYQPMLDTGATTVWESFPDGTTGSDGFPTRSHTHAWSSAPIHSLNRIVLGIVPEAPGGKAFRVSPRLNNLEWARGASGSVAGPVEVSWKRAGDTLTVDAKASEGVALRFERNDSHEGLKVIFNGKAQ